MGIGDELLGPLWFGDFYYMRDIGRRVRGLGASRTFVPYLVSRSQEWSSLGCDFVKTPSVFCHIALVYGVFVDDSVLLP
jgi:hypothetical protein